MKSLNPNSLKPIVLRIWITSMVAVSMLPYICVASENAPDAVLTGSDASSDGAQTSTPEDAGNAVDWRNDSTIRRRPASYIGGSLNYVQAHTWLAENDDHKKLTYGPLHSGTMLMRVGDAFGDKFAIGFQVQTVNIKSPDVQLSAFALLLDLSFYPWKGLGIRPSAGFGFGFAQGENKWEFGFGGPGALALSLLYEFRVTRKFTLAPVVTTTWLTGDGYDSIFTFAGIEALFWLPNKHRYDQ
ncbi:MAG: hypothetical protein JXX14_10310 [Deltaproteobacteria bacterium]|nr:hypothetical protein [Deltaproteobacteria bacterium]